MAARFLCFALLLCAGQSLAKSAFKHLAGGPSEFLPPADSADAAVESHIRLLSSTELKFAGGLRANDQTFMVDSNDFNFVALCSAEKDLNSLSIVIKSPSGTVSKPTTTADGPFGLGGRTYPSRSLYFVGVEKGEWSVTVALASPVEGRQDADPIKVFTFVTFADGDSQVSVTVSSSSLQTLLGNSVELKAVVVDQTLRSGNRTRARRSGGSPTEVVDLLVRHPSGKTTTEPMHESFTQNDDSPAFVAPLTLSEVGSYRAVVVVKGQRSDGLSYERSAWYWLTVVEKSATLSGSVTVTPSQADCHRDLKAEQLTINLGLKSNGENSIPASPPYRVYAEIFSGDAANLNGAQPVAWIGGLSDVTELKSQSVLNLHLDTSWLHGYKGPFHLRNVRVEELDTYSIVTSAEVLDLPIEVDTVLRLGAMPPVKEITRQMRQGYHVGRRRSNSSHSAQASPLLLVHGYCAPETPFSVDDFTGYRVFEDLNQNRRINDFSRLVADFGAEHESFGVVGHSQGGFAVLDMYTYLSTGLDNAVGDRRIQTLATPWRGSPLSGLLAIIGDLLGIGCGDNTDMSYDGATKWLAGIPVDTRSEVYYYTGQYGTGSLINYCILAANAVLSWPNDGMIEQKRSDLDGGHNMGHYKGECHSVNMRDPPICKNHERNALLNILAAR